jgi:hypothetical protein
VIKGDSIGNPPQLVRRRRCAASADLDLQPSPAVADPHEHPSIAVCLEQLQRGFDDPVAAQINTGARFGGIPIGAQGAVKSALSNRLKQRVELRQARLRREFAWVVLADEVAEGIHLRRELEDAVSALGSSAIRPGLDFGADVSHMSTPSPKSVMGPEGS